MSSLATLDLSELQRSPRVVDEVALAKGVNIVHDATLADHRWYAPMIMQLKRRFPAVLSAQKDIELARP